MSEFIFNTIKAQHAIAYCLQLQCLRPRVVLLNASVWHLCEYGRPLFGGRVMCGKNKPYIYELKYTSTAGNYNPDHLSASDIKAIDGVRYVNQTNLNVMSLYDLHRYQSSATTIPWREIAVQSGANEAMLQYIDQRISNCQCL